MSDENRASTPVDQMVVVRADEMESSFKSMAQQLEETAPASMHAVRKYHARRAARAHWPGVNGSFTIPERPVRNVGRSNRRTVMYRTAFSIVVMIGGGVVIRFYLKF